MEGNMASSGEGAHLIGGEELKICSTDDSVEEADIPQLVANLIKHYSESGAPSHRAEEKAHRLFSVLNLNATCVCLPTGHTFTFDQNRVIYVSLEDPSLSLRGVEAVEALIKCVRTNGAACFVKEANRVMREKDVGFHPALSFAARVISPPFAVAVFFGGTFVDMACALVMSVVLSLVSLLGVASGYSPFARTFDRIFYTLAGFLVALMARTASSLNLIEHTCNRAVQLATIVDLLPGVSITLSVLELSANRSVSGTVRLFSALVTAFLIGFGLAYGNLLAGVWSAPLPTDPICKNPNPSLNISTWFTLLFLPFQLAGYAIQLNAPLVRWPFMFLAGIVSWAVTYGFSFVKVEGVEGLGTVSAGFAVGCVGGLAEKLTKNKTSSMSPILEGILILVPGSIAVLSIANAFEGNVSNGISFGLRFISVAVAITVGVFLAGVLFVIPWRGRAKRLGRDDPIKFLL